MKEKNMKQEKGITLIALVITIIVLLILAGVAISMLSGENGILNQAAESKEKTESESFIEQVRVVAMGAMTNKDAEINKDELITELNKLDIKENDIISYENGEYLIIKGTEKIIINNNGKVEYDDEIKEIDIELQKYFNKQKLDYKCKYGFVTGFEYKEETVAEVEEKLPEGYEINSRYIGSKESDENIDDKSINISTGMAITKNGQEVARTVVFGEINCDKKGNVTAADVTTLNEYICFERDLKDFQKIAANVYRDEELNFEDYLEILNQVKRRQNINQQASIIAPASKLRRCYTKLQQYISLLDAKTGYSFEYNEEADTYKLKGVKEGTTVENLINSLPEKDKIKVFSKTDSEVSGESIVEDGYYLELQVKYYISTGAEITAGCEFAYIEIEK